MRQLSERQAMDVDEALGDWTWRDAEQMVRAHNQVVTAWALSHEPDVVLDASLAGGDFTRSDGQALIDAIRRKEVRLRITDDVEVIVTYNAHRSFTRRTVNLARLRWRRLAEDLEQDGDVERVRTTT